MKKIKVVAILFVLLGTGLIASATLPIARYEFLSHKTGRQRQFLSPIAAAGKVAGPSQPYPLNLTSAANWFVGTPQLGEVVSKVKYYNVSVPRLKIERAVAEIGGDDLSKSLVHFKGTSLPGKPGNAVIFGHSTLQPFFNAKNYLTIFSYLPDLNKGDEIKVEYDGITYTYRVGQVFEVAPDAIEILEQRMDNSYLTLVTCVPPGTYLRRLVVKARIVPPAGKSI